MDSKLDTFTQEGKPNEMQITRKTTVEKCYFGLLRGCFARFSDCETVPNRATHHKCCKYIIKTIILYLYQF